MGEQHTSSHPMIPVPDAIRVVLQTTAEAILQHDDVGTEKIAADASSMELLGRILAKDVVMSDPGYPPYRASIMDGYVIKSQDTKTKVENDERWTHRVLRRIYTGAVDTVEDLAGDDTNNNSLPGAIYITTGAKVPDSYDCVVPIEQIVESVDKTMVRLSEKAVVEHGRFIREIGCDIPAGDVVLPRGFFLNPVSLGLLQQSGQYEIELIRSINVGVLSTGNELLLSTDSWASDNHQGNGTLIQTGQIPDVNKPILMSLITSFGNCQPIDLGMSKDDDPDGMAQMIHNELDTCDVILTTGGISMGETDIVEDVLQKRLGGTLHFGRLNMKPGKPTTFITIPTPGGKKKCLVFALPGNPVSAVVCTHLVVKPCLDMLVQYRSKGAPDTKGDVVEVVKQMVLDSPVQREVVAQLTHDITLDKERPEYHRVYLLTKMNSLDHVEYQAFSTGIQQSSRLMSLRDAQGLLVLPTASKQQPKALAGQKFPVLLLQESHRPIRVKDSLHLQERKSESQTRVVILQVAQGASQMMSVTDASRIVQESLSGRNSGAVNVITCQQLLGLNGSDLVPSIHKLMVREKNAIDIMVVSCTGSFSYCLEMSEILRKEVSKLAEAIALQARRGAAAQDGTAALFEPVVGFLVPKNHNEEQGLVLIALPEKGLGGGLRNVRCLLKHALHVGRGKEHKHHHNHGIHQHEAAHPNDSTAPDS